MLVLNTSSPPTVPDPASASPAKAAPSSRTMSAALGKVVPGDAAGGDGELDAGRELPAEPGRVAGPRLERLLRDLPRLPRVDDAEAGARALGERRRIDAG